MWEVGHHRRTGPRKAAVDSRFNTPWAVEGSLAIPGTEAYTREGTHIVRFRSKADEVAPLSARKVPHPDKARAARAAVLTRLGLIAMPPRRTRLTTTKIVQ